MRFQYNRNVRRFFPISVSTINSNERTGKKSNYITDTHTHTHRYTYMYVQQHMQIGENQYCGHMHNGACRELNDQHKKNEINLNCVPNNGISISMSCNNPINLAQQWFFQSSIDMPFDFVFYCSKFMNFCFLNDSGLTVPIVLQPLTYAAHTHIHTQT